MYECLFDYGRMKGGDYMEECCENCMYYNTDTWKCQNECSVYFNQECDCNTVCDDIEL